MNLLQVFNTCKNCGWTNFGPRFWEGEEQPNFPAPEICPDCAEQGEAADGEIEQDVVDVDRDFDA